MADELKERILNICSELGEDIDSPDCKKLREHVASCQDSSAFVDSVKKTISLYKAYGPPIDRDTSSRLLGKLGLD